MRLILITGGAGFIGSHTAELLLARGYRVRILDSLQPRVHPHGWPSYLPAEAERLQGDVRVPADLARALEGVDAVIHLAAYQDYMPDYSTFLHVNTVGPALLYEIVAARRLPVRKVVVASSQAVYGEGEYVCAEHGSCWPQARSAEQLDRGDWEVRCPVCAAPMQPVLLTEGRVQPHTPYGISKYAAELVSLNLGRMLGIPTVNLRYSIVQGPRNSFYNAYSGICRIFTLRLLHGQPPVCYEDGQQRRDYVSVLDVARANVLVLEDSRADFRVFNVAGQKATTVLEYAQLLIRLTGAAVEPMLTGEFRFGDTRHTVSSGAALAELGWRPEVPLEQFVADYLAWVRAQPAVGDFFTAATDAMRQARVLRRARRP